MALAVFLLYVVVEVAVLVWVGSLIGVGWTILLVLGSSLLGLVLFGSQSRKALTRLAQASQGEGSPAKAVADSLIVTVSGFLLFVPGLVTTGLGLLGLFPPTRGVLRPLLTLVAARKLGGLGAAMAGGASYARMRQAGFTVIDGEVVEDAPHRPGAAGSPAARPRGYEDGHLVIEPGDHQAGFDTPPPTSKDENPGRKQAD